MAAEPSRRISKACGLIVRPQPVSDKTYVGSVVDFINEVVPQSKQGEKETIVWVKFDYCDLNDYNLLCDEAEPNANHPSLLIILGYTNGVQVWCVPASGEAQEVLSYREGPVKFLKILPTPELVDNCKDNFGASRPLIAICDSSSAGEPFCAINFVSLKTGDTMEILKYKTQVFDLKCVKRVIAVIFMDKIILYKSHNLKETLVVSSCYTSPSLSVNPVALGTRWMAFANKKLVSVHQSGGGMAGDGVHSYAATIIHAAKSGMKGISFIGETLSSSFFGQKPARSSSSKSDSKSSDDSQPGIVTVIDTRVLSGEVNLCVRKGSSVHLLGNIDQINIDDDNDGEGLIAHFPAHANEPVAALEFDHSGMLLFTSCRLGHSFHIFRIFPHPASSAMGAVHHLYTLHRGETTSKVQDVTFSLDSRWVSVTTMRGTTHIFPITPYGGPITARTHTSPQVVNRLSRYQRSAGMEDFQIIAPTGRNSPVLSGSPGSSGSGLARPYDYHPSLDYYSSFPNRIPNSRLPPYPHPTTIPPLAQLKQAITNPLASSAKPQSPGGDRMSQRKSSITDTMSVASAFSPARAWLVGSPSLTRDKRDKFNLQDKYATDSLFIIDFRGNLVEYILLPKPAAGSQKMDDESPIELEVIAHAQWALLRPTTSSEIQPPLPNTSPLMFTPDVCAHEGSKARKSDDAGILSSEEKPSEKNENWLSEVEIITHAGPHRRLWMGPQFSFQTFQDSSNTTVLSSDSSALLSQSPENRDCLSSNIYVQQLDVQSLRPARSNPMAMPGSHQASGSPNSMDLFRIDAGSGSFELPTMLDWPDSSSTKTKDREEEIMQSLAEAMIEDTFDPLRREGGLQYTMVNLENSGELSSGSSHSGSVSHTYDSGVSPQSCMDHALVFPSSSGSPDSL